MSSFIIAELHRTNPPTSPTYVNVRHRKVWIKAWRKWNVLDKERTFEYTLLRSLKAIILIIFPEMKTSSHQLHRLQYPPIQSIFTAQCSSCFINLLISGSAIFSNQADYFLDPILGKKNCFPHWTGMLHLIRNIWSLTVTSNIFSIIKIACNFFKYQYITLKMDFKYSSCDWAESFTGSLH